MRNVTSKVEFNQPSCWLYFVPNLLVIQHLETLYLGGNHVRVVCEKVCTKTGPRDWLAACKSPKASTCVKHAGELKSHTGGCTIGQKSQAG